MIRCSPFANFIFIYVRGKTLIPRLHDTAGCQTDCTTGLTTGCIHDTATGLTTVLNEQPLFVQLVVKPVVKPGLIVYRPTNIYPFDNRLYRVNGASVTSSDSRIAIRDVEYIKNNADDGHTSAKQVYCFTLPKNCQKSTPLNDLEPVMVHMLFNSIRLFRVHIYQCWVFK